MGNYRNFGDKTPVCIIRWKPKWYEGLYYPLLSPPSDLLVDIKYNDISIAEYSARMNAYLQTLNQNQVFNDLKSFGDNLVLLCTCKDHSICHRSIVAKWLSDYLDIEIKEL